MQLLRPVLLVLLVGSAAGCGVLRALQLAPPTRSESLARMDPARIQADTMGFADRFVTAMTGVYDEVERRAPTRAGADAAHQLKTDLALGAISDAVNPRPIAGLMDLVVFVRLLREIAQDPTSFAVFGADNSRLINSLNRQEADVRLMASKYLTDPQLAELSQLADEWHRAHPNDRSVSHVHLADLPEANRTPEPGGKLPSSVFGLLFFDPTANLDPAVREIELSRATSERMFFYFQRLPLLLQLQAEAFYRQIFETPQFNAAAENASAIAASTTRFADTSSRFTEVVARFPKELSEERQDAVRQIAGEVTQQRDAAIRQLSNAASAQREAAISQASVQIAAQREQAIQQIASALHQEQEVWVSNMEEATNRSINRLISRLAALMLGAFVLVLAAAFAYRRLKRREVQVRVENTASTEAWIEDEPAPSGSS